MNAEKYHPSLRPLEEACRLAQSGWYCIPNPLVGRGGENSLLWKTGILLRHMALVFRCWKAISCRHILVREFSTLPLLFVFPLLWPLRNKLYFLIHHNLQWAIRSRIERFGMLTLARVGARWAIFETQDFPMFGKICVPSPRNLVLPHPVPEKFSKHWKKNGSPMIGVAGYYRPEKGVDELLRLLTKHFPDCEIVAGVPNPEAVNIPSVTVLDTTSDESYRRMLARCDVLVQNGARDSYFYRASGVIADAAACGTAVVVPDYPLLRQQVTVPVSIGEVFQGLGPKRSESAFGYSQKKRHEGEWQQMPEAVRCAVEKTRTGQYNFNAYCAARSAQALADCLDEFSRRQDG